MKSKILFACALMAAITFTSCDKKEKDPEPVINPQPVTGLTAKVDGVDWTAVIPMATNSDGDFVLGGANMSGQTIGLFGYQANITKPGTYPVAAVYMLASQDSSSGPSWVSPNATVTISKLDMSTKKLSGTFSFTAIADQSTGATGTKTITNGTFTDITIQ